MSPEEFNRECEAFAEKQARGIMQKLGNVSPGAAAALFAAFRAQRSADLQLAMLVDRLDAIEAKGIAEYLGVFDLTATYSRGAMVSWGGSVYCCRENGTTGKTPGKPGNESNWTLAVKRGGDGSSAYASALKHGFTGSERDWVEALKRGHA